MGWRDLTPLESTCVLCRSPSGFASAVGLRCQMMAWLRRPVLRDRLQGVQPAAWSCWRARSLAYRRPAMWASRSDGKLPTKSYSEPFKVAATAKRRRDTWVTVQERWQAGAWVVSLKGSLHSCGRSLTIAGLGGIRCRSSLPQGERGLGGGAGLAHSCCVGS